MKVHRFFSQLKRDRDAVSFADPDVTHQILRVLKLRVGEVVTVLDGKGMEYDVELVQVDKKDVAGIVIAERKNETEPEREVVLYAAILKRENFEWAVQKAVECGVSKIVPMVTQRTIKKDVKQERLQEIAKEAAELSGRGRVPEVSEPVDFDEALNGAKGEKYFLDAGGSTFDAMQAAPSVSLFIGPEGGWTDEERANAKRAGLTTISLGPRVLRGETASALAVYLMTI
ncbi:16S rRNA (uracil(1498)-N(3))-methyltransferase [Candidatus Uhrbacteria bacterium]|nr:16S rRNA (uracil(1498)-N(3))-methyltransferase [Candidatus Uhrbacteria bacterium]